jgi:exopolysaccharide transport family protein
LIKEAELVMAGLNGSYQDVDIDLARVMSAVWERKGRILAATLGLAGVALVATSLMTPSYRAETRLLIESRSPNLNGGDAAAAANDPVLDSLNVTSQAQLLQSTDLIRRVASELKLASYKEFDPAGQSFLPDPLVLIGLKPDPMTLDPEDRVIREFREKLQVYAVENSRVIAIEFSSHDPQLAAAIPNKMAEVYLELQSGAKLDTHSETAKWLEPEIANLTRRVREAESKVADYRSQNGLFQTTETNSFSTQQLNDISTELARVRGERANAEARAENVRAALEAGRDADTLADVVSSQVIQRLKEAEANLQAQISDQSTVLLDNHPRLRGLRAQLAGIRQQIDSETRKILGSLDSEAEVSRLREQQLMTQLNTLKADSARAGEEEVGLRALEREAAAQRQLLETYLARYREATSRLESNATPADARIVSRAVEPAEAYFPKIIPIVIVVALATLIVSCLIVMVMELFSGRALRPVGRQVEPAPEPVAPASTTAVAEPAPAERPVSVTEKPSLADASAILPPAVVATAEPAMTAETVTQAAPRKDEQVMTERADAQAVEPVAAQAGSADEPADIGFSIGSVAHYLQRHAVPVAISVSPAGDEGSTATVMLARAVAEAGRTVVLIDLTGSACPTLLMAEHGRLPGITDLLCGETAFGDAIHRDRLSEAHIVPQGISEPERAMRGADRLTMILDALSDAYDLVLVECGPADKGGLSRLVRGERTEIILSVPGFEEKDIADLVIDYAEAGFRNLLVMSQQDDRSTPDTRRRSAA